LRHAENREFEHLAAKDRVGEATRGVSERRLGEEGTLKALSAKHLRAYRTAESELARAEDKFLSEERIRLLFGLESVEDGRNVLKRAKTRLGGLMVKSYGPRKKPDAGSS
jgi:hypothetical protein